MKINKFLIFLLILIMAMLPTFCLGADENFDTAIFESNTASGSIASFVDNSFAAAIHIVRIVGIGISVIILMVIACKYMLAAPGDRADIKKHAVPFVVGACVMFGTTGILGIIADIASNIK